MKGSFNSDSKRIKTLEGDEASNYLDGINLRLGNLLNLFSMENQVSVLPYIERLIQSNNCLSHKHKLNGFDKLDFSLTIDHNNSGFPTTKDYLLLEINKKNSKEVLDILPNRNAIIEKLRNAIFRSDSPLTYQAQLMKQSFYSALNETDLIQSFEISPEELISEEGKRRKYTISWNCLERGSNLPVFYRLCFLQSENGDFNIKNFPTLETIFYQLQSGHDIGLIVKEIDKTIPKIHPKMMEKYRIGPYYDLNTNNTPELQYLIDECGEPILKFSVEKILSEGIKKYGNLWDLMVGNKTEMENFGPVDKEIRMIVPYRVKQMLKGKDENGNPAVIYGVTKKGEII